MAKLGGYVGKLLRVDLTNERQKDEYVDEASLGKYIGGLLWGRKSCTTRRTEWSDPENRIIWMTSFCRQQIIRRRQLLGDNLTIINEFTTKRSLSIDAGSGDIARS